MRKTLGTLGIGLIAACTFAANAAEISDGAVKIGILTDMSGQFSDLGGKGSVAAAELAIEDFHGHVAGAPIQLITADHQNKTDVAATTARGWYQRDGVDMINDLTNSSVAVAVSEVGRQLNKVVIVNGAATTLLTNENCAPYSVHFAYDGYATGQSLAQTVVARGGKTWYFITQDAVGGLGLEKAASEFVVKNGGQVLGSSRHPMVTSDFSSYIVAAKNSHADVIAFANAGADLANSMKAAREFGIKDQQLVATLAMVSDVHGLGLERTQGMLAVSAFYWDMDDRTRKFGRRFFDKMKRMPTDVQAGVYSSTLLYLKAVEKAGTDDPARVIAAMKTIPIDDVFKHGKLRADGSVMHDMYLMEVKKPSESRYPWDYFKLVSVVPAEKAYQPLDQSRCKLLTAK